MELYPAHFAERLVSGMSDAIVPAIEFGGKRASIIVIWRCGFARSPANAIYRTRNRSCSISPDDMRVGPITWTATRHSYVRNSAHRIARSKGYVASANSSSILMSHQQIKPFNHI